MNTTLPTVISEQNRFKERLRKVSMHDMNSLTKLVAKEAMTNTADPHEFFTAIRESGSRTGVVQPLKFTPDPEAFFDEYYAQINWLCRIHCCQYNYQLCISKDIRRDL